MPRYSTTKKIRYYLVWLFKNQEHRKSVDEKNRSSLVKWIKMINYCVRGVFIENFIQDRVVDVFHIDKVYIRIWSFAIIAILVKVWKKIISSKNLYLWLSITWVSLFTTYKIVKNESKT